jgi:starch phosphorylase
MLPADYQSHIDCQDRVSATYVDTEQWTGKSILNVVHIGKFSSDGSVMEYAEKISLVKPVKIAID